MHYMWSSYIYFSTTYYLLDYNMKYLTLGHTRPGIIIATKKGEYNPTNKVIQLEINFTLSLSSINSEK